MQLAGEKIRPSSHMFHLHGPVCAIPSASLFKASVERALQLGLRADVAACRHIVERRKRQMGVRMLAVGMQASAKSVLGEMMC